MSRTSRFQIVTIAATGSRNVATSAPGARIGRALALAAYVALAIASGGTVMVGSAGDAHAARCGGANQKACTVLQRPGKPCDRGLKLTSIIGGKCMRPAPPSAYNVLLKATKSHRAIMGKVMACMKRPAHARDFRRAVKAKAEISASRVVSKCLSSRDRARLRTPLKNTSSKTNGKAFNLLNVGLSGGVQAEWGAGVESGIVIDLTGARPVRLYTVSGTSKGASLSIGADVNIGLSYDKMPSRKKITKDTSYVFAGKLLAGLGVSFDFDGHLRQHFSRMPLNKLGGISMAGGIGLGFDMGSRHKQITTIW